MSAPALALPYSLQPNEGVLDPPSHEDIAEFAYALWQERGSPVGSPEEDWFQAERWLCGGSRGTASFAEGDQPG